MGIPVDSNTKNLQSLDPFGSTHVSDTIRIVRGHSVVQECFLPLDSISVPKTGVRDEERD